MQLEFFTVDVFTDRKFAGNPLAVIVNAEGLATGQMQAIAAEFNLAETTFVLPPKQAGHTAQVRIFTPRAEIPFAGHPNIGTAFVLAREAERQGRPFAGGVLMFEETAGLVRMELAREGERTTGARLASPKPLAVGGDVEAGLVAEACGLSPGDIETARHRPLIASCGMPFVFAELKAREALAAARPVTDVFTKHLPRDQVTGIHLYVHSDDGEAQVRSRMFAPLHGIPEDPATGSANVALIGLLAHLRAEPDLELSRRIAQGVEMGRPSLLEAMAQKRDGVVTATFIGGACVPVMHGTLQVE
jgi:trans-2,3-dihydro-3-hydroxyanthranilate isomerase